MENDCAAHVILEIIICCNIVIEKYSSHTDELEPLETFIKLRGFTENKFKGEKTQCFVILEIVCF